MIPSKTVIHRRQASLLLVVTALAAALPAAADVRLPRIFTDHMMFQRDMPVRVWGWAEAGEEVRVSLAGKTAMIKADAAGKWKLELPALKEGEGMELTVQGKNSLTLKNVILGDRWVCSGQSNMEMRLEPGLQLTSVRFIVRRSEELKGTTRVMAMGSSSSPSPEPPTQDPQP